MFKLLKHVWDHIFNKYDDLEIDLPPRITSAATPAVGYVQIGNIAQTQHYTSGTATNPWDRERLTAQSSGWNYQYTLEEALRTDPVRHYEIIYDHPIEIIYLAGEITYYHDTVFWTRPAIERHLKEMHDQLKQQKPNYSLGDI